MEEGVSLFMSTFPPRKCGIGTFTKDLTEALDLKFNPTFKTKIIALNDFEDCYEYSSEVMHEVIDSDYDGFLKIADKINSDDRIRCVSIQHEFGIFGGERSAHPLPFLDRLKKPAMITFHSVFPKPEQEVRHLVRAISKRVGKIIVMTDKAVELLRDDYGIEKGVEVIPHGIPEVDFLRQGAFKRKFGLERKLVLSSFGMLGPGKGYEFVIDSLPEIVKRFPDVVYLIIGKTHPGVIDEEGETYRKSLKKRVEELGLVRNVLFVNKYLSVEELLNYLRATDVYVSASQNPEQITSGTLVYAMGCGRAVVSSPFPHAVDVVKEENGILVGFEDSAGYSSAIIELFSNPSRREEIEKRNFEMTRKMTWGNVALEYGRVMKELF